MADGTRTIHITSKVDESPTRHFSDVNRVLVEKGVMKLWHESGDYTEIKIDDHHVSWD
jgi:hypothetical protein